MTETNTQMLTRITKVLETNSEGTANEHLKAGWRLLSVEQVPMRDGGDTWVSTKYVLGLPNQDPLGGLED